MLNSENIGVLRFSARTDDEVRESTDRAAKRTPCKNVGYLQVFFQF
jgi:hypothetical protein